MKKLVALLLTAVFIFLTPAAYAYTSSGGTDWGGSSSSAPTPSPTPTATPTPEKESEPAKLFNPKQTNELFLGLIEGADAAKATGELEGLEFDNSVLWAVNGWTRGWLITSLTMDLSETDKDMYDKYAEASLFYVALIPPIFSTDIGFTYFVMLIDGKNSLNINYKPGSTSCGYSEMTDITQANIDNLSLAAIKVWEVTEEDFACLVEKMNEIDNSNLYSVDDNEHEKMIIKIEEVCKDEALASFQKVFNNTVGGVSWNKNAEAKTIYNEETGKFKCYVSTEYNSTISGRVIKHYLDITYYGHAKGDKITIDTRY